MSKIFTTAILCRLAANGAATRLAQNAGQAEPDHVPVLKVFNPYGAATWLLTESDPDNPDCLFGLCDLGFGTPELGSVLRSELEGLRIPIGNSALPLERDLFFETAATISQLADAARAAGRIEA